MSNVLSKAVKIAQERMVWEKEINPNGGPMMKRGLSAEEEKKARAFILNFQSAVRDACETGALDTPEKAKAAVRKLDYDTEYMPFWQFSEVCVPVEPATALLAREIAPSRTKGVELARTGEFGSFKLDESEAGVIVHRAAKLTADVNFDEDAPKTKLRGDAAKEALVRKSATTAAAFKDLSGKMGAAIKGAAEGKKVEEALKSLDKLGGTRMVEGERKKVAAVGQQGLFDEETAPIPEGAKRPRKASAPKARK